MPQVPRLLKPISEAEQTVRQENEYHQWLQQAAREENKYHLMLLKATPHLAEEDNNLGDEAFVYFREDPEYMALIVR